MTRTLRWSVMSVLGMAGAALVLAASAPAPTREARPPRVTPAREAPPAQAGALEPFLESAPELKKHLVWTTGDGKRQPFDQWTPAMKQRIDGFYGKLMAGTRDLGMRLPNPEAIMDGGGHAFFTVDQAFEIYAAHAAHVLYVESKHLVPWSIQSFPAAELDQLLASSSYFARIGKSARTDYPAGIQANRDFAEPPENDQLGELISDPRIGYDLLSGKTSASRKSLIGKDELETLVHLTAWLRDNVGHGPMDGSARELVKKYRWLNERLRPLPGNRMALALQGCHSASKLMVDLARSVNIPLLHTRGADNELRDSECHFFNRTHGGLIFGWGSPRVRILWHTDELYAMADNICFPIDPRTGALLTQGQADQLYFDENWLTPQRLRKVGFVYRLQRVLPNKGFGHTSAGQYEDRLDYGMMSGFWNKKGKSKLDEMFLWNHYYALCGQPLLSLAKNNVVEAQLQSNYASWKGDYADNELPPQLTLKEYADRAAAGLKAVGGGDRFEALCKERAASRGSNLLAGPGPRRLNGK